MNTPLPPAAAGAAVAPGVVPALETRGLRKEFRGLLAVAGVDLVLQPGTRHALIGPNGAGKTTLVNLISGHLKASGGELFLYGENITRRPEHRRTRLGLVRTFQINQLFRQLTVLENVLLAVSQRTGASRNLWRPLGRYEALADEALAILASVGLEDDALRRVAELPYGRQRLVEIAVALGLRPRVLLLDEPTAGVPSGESEPLLEALRALGRDLAILIIEHDMEMVFRFAERISVMMNGSLLREGTPAEISADAAVREAYLGEDDHVRSL
ncbi:MAG TPA: ABC transporter ATP-binding protein [bacterium]|jgi:ABC-type branched-subunit amino acid transport system ATPase component